MPRLKMHKLTDDSLVPKKGEPTGKLKLVPFIMPRFYLAEFYRLASAGRKTPLNEKGWFAAINEAIRELLQDIDVSLAQGINVSTSPSEDVWYEGYRKFTRSDAQRNINGERKFNTVVIPVERKYLYGLPEIRGFNQTYFIDRYMPERDQPIASKVELNTKLIEKLMAVKDKYDIFIRDLIAQAVERKAARLRATGLYSDEEYVERPIEKDTDKNQYNPYGDAFERERL